MPNVRYSVFRIESSKRIPIHKELTRAQLSSPIPYNGLIISAVIIDLLIKHLTVFPLALLICECLIFRPEIPLLQRLVTPKSSRIRLDGSRGSKSINSSPYYYAAQNIITGTGWAYFLLVGSK